MPDLLDKIAKEDPNAFLNPIPDDRREELAGGDMLDRIALEMYSPLRNFANVIAQQDSITEIVDIAEEIGVSPIDVWRYHEALTKKPEKTEKKEPLGMQAWKPPSTPERFKRFMWQWTQLLKPKEMFLGDTSAMPPNPDRMEIFKQGFNQAIGRPLWYSFKILKGRTMGLPEIMWAGLKRALPDSVWDDEIKHMNLEEAINFTSGYYPTAFEQMLGDMSEFISRLYTVAPIAQKLGIIRKGAEHLTWLQKAGEAARLGGISAGITEIMKLGAIKIDPTDTEYGYEGPKAVLRDMALFAIFSMAHSGVKSIWAKLTPTEHARALKLLGLKEGATEAEIDAAAKRLALKYNYNYNRVNMNSEQVLALEQQFKEVIAARELLKQGELKDIVFRGQKITVRPKLLPGEAAPAVEVPAKPEVPMKPEVPPARMPGEPIMTPPPVAEAAPPAVRPAEAAEAEAEAPPEPPPSARYAVVAQPSDLREKIKEAHKGRPEIVNFIEEIDAIGRKPSRVLFRESNAFRMAVKRAMGLLPGRGQKDLQDELLARTYIAALQDLSQPSAAPSGREGAEEYDPGTVAEAKKLALKYGESPGAVFMFGGEKGPWHDAIMEWFYEQQIKGLHRPRKITPVGKGGKKAGKVEYSPATVKLWEQTGRVDYIEEMSDYQIRRLGTQVGRLPRYYERPDTPPNTSYLGMIVRRRLTGTKNAPLMTPVLEERALQILSYGGTWRVKEKPFTQRSPLDAAARKRFIKLFHEGIDKRLDGFLYAAKHMPEHMSAFAEAWEQPRLWAHWAAGPQSRLESWTSWKAELARIKGYTERPAVEVIGEVPRAHEKLIKTVQKSKFPQENVSIYEDTDVEVQAHESEARKSIGDQQYEADVTAGLSHYLAGLTYFDPHRGQSELQSIVRDMARLGYLPKSYITSASKLSEQKCQNILTRLKNGTLSD